METWNSGTLNRDQINFLKRQFIKESIQLSKKKLGLKGNEYEHLKKKKKDHFSVIEKLLKNKDS